MFKFKPEGISLNGMQRVYFTCHPEDHARYFERISDDILKVQRCAVFYNLDEGEYEDAETDLAQMNLFVIPVTTRLLTKPCRTVKFDIPFAMEHHIPILPLMMESGLDELYERVFGDLHYLDPNANDDTARSFDEKFKNYITSVLIGDELAEKIRKAFDAYIFLSYRKKDRRYANELMRLIHKNEFCRDIAIWYDEFLTPGEGFNEAIAAALEKSELFALVVTPNLLELNDLGLPNYVMKEEYPAARRSGKKVLPAEMEETDGEALSGKFDGIGSTVKKEDEAALSAALHDALGEIAIAENDDDPEHNFFIGLAYLGGIDVEIDHERAKRLIEGAAEAGLIEAAKKLVSMYENGEGVQRDYPMAIEWRKKLVELLEKRAEAEESLENRIELLNALWALGDALKAVGRLDEAKGAYQKTCNVAKKYYEVQPDLFFHELSTSLNYLGDICFMEGDLSGARNCFLRSFEITNLAFDSIRMSDRTAETIDLAIVLGRDYSLALHLLGRIYMNEGSFNNARELYSCALELLEHIASETNAVQAKRNLSACLDDLGDVSSAEGKISEAKAFYTRSVKLLEHIVSETNTVQARRDLSITLGRLSHISIAQYDIHESRKFASHAFEISKLIAEETDSLEARRDLSLNLMVLSTISEVEGDIDQAQEHLLHSFDILGRIAKETNTIEANYNLSLCLVRLGDISMAQGDEEAAESFYLRSLGINECIAEKTGTFQSKRNLFSVLEKLGNLSLNDGNLDKAQKFFSRALKVAELLAKSTGTLQSLRELSLILQKLGSINLDIGNTARAKRLYSRAVKNNSLIAKQSKTAAAMLDLWSSVNTLGEIMCEDDAFGAENQFLRALKLAEQVAKENNSPSTLTFLCISLERLGNFYADMTDYDNAKRYFSRALDTAEQIYDDSNPSESKEHLFSALKGLVYIAKIYGEYDIAERYNNRMIETSKRIADETGSKEALEQLMYLYYANATLNMPYNEAFLKKAIGVCEILVEQYPYEEEYQHSYQVFVFMLDNRENVDLLKRMGNNP